MRIRIRIRIQVQRMKTQEKENKTYSTTKQNSRTKIETVRITVGDYINLRTNTVKIRMFIHNKFIHINDKTTNN